MPKWVMLCLVIFWMYHWWWWSLDMVWVVSYEIGFISRWIEYMRSLFVVGEEHFVVVKFYCDCVSLSSSPTVTTYVTRIWLALSLKVIDQVISNLSHSNLWSQLSQISVQLEDFNVQYSEICLLNSLINSQLSAQIINV